MADELNVIVVQVQTTGDWDVSCFNPICGEGIHGVGESPSKGRADAMARRHRLAISREIERQGEPPAIVNWRTRAEEAEAAIARVREVHDVHSCERDGHIHRSTPNPCVNDGFCSCGQRSPCPTLAALDSPDVTL